MTIRVIIATLDLYIYIYNDDHGIISSCFRPRKENTRWRSGVKERAAHYYFSLSSGDRLRTFLFLGREEI